MDRSRQPCGSGRKLVWLLHELIFGRSELLRNLDHLVTWGQAGRDDTLIVDHGKNNGPVQLEKPSEHEA